MWRRLIGAFEAKASARRSNSDPASAQTLSDVYEEVVKSVFHIATSSAEGTGFLVRDDGLVVTNSHVVRGVREVTLQANTGPTLNGEVILSDRKRDLAAIRICNPDVAANIPILPVTTSRNAKIGSEVIAIGNPVESAAFSLARGILSAVGHMVDKQPFLQASIPINWGNSGGPLLALEGLHAIGMVTGGAFVMQGRVEGLCFAIPGDDLIQFIARVPRLTTDAIGKAYCIVCGHLGKGNRYCENCGVSEARQKPQRDSEIAPPQRSQSKCSCGKANDYKVRYCTHCGRDLRSL